MTTFDYSTDIIDSRDLASRIDDLESRLGDDEVDPLEADEFEELEELRSVAEEVGEFYDGNTLVRRSYWVEYAQKLAEDIGLLPDTYQWPTSCIDWQHAADELEHDYGAIKIQGIEFLYRHC